MFLETPLSLLQNEWHLKCRLSNFFFCTNLHCPLAYNIREIGDKNLGVCYQSLGQYDKAISHFQDGLKIAKKVWHSAVCLLHSFLVLNFFL